MSRSGPTPANNAHTLTAEAVSAQLEGFLQIANNCVEH